MEFDESLLCDEVCLSSPAVADHPMKYHQKEYRAPHNSHCGSSPLSTASKEEYEEALTICLQKEMSYLPRPIYLEKLISTDLVIARFKSIGWFIKVRSRLNLSLETVFYAANYLDRFISMKHCNEWKYWMVELLSVACLSIAIKFNDTCTPSLLEIQMDDLDQLFESSTVQRMEMMVLEELGWRLASTTSFSFLELLLASIHDFLKPELREQFVARLNEFLLGTISDSKLLQFRPSVIALSALRCNLNKALSPEFDNNLQRTLTSLLDHDQKVQLVKCQKIMEAQSVVNNSLYNLIPHGLFRYCPSSPTTVLPKARISFSRSEYRVDFSLFKMRDQDIDVESTIIKKDKRKREEEGEED